MTHKRILPLGLSLSLCLGALAPLTASAFDPMAHHAVAQQRFVSETGEATRAGIFYQHKLMEKLAEIEAKLKTGEIAVQDDPKDQKLLALIKTRPEWREEFVVLADVIWAFLAKYYIISDPEVCQAVMEVPEIAASCKEAAVDIIQDNPHFSNEFKEHMRKKIMAVSISVCGFDEFTAVPRFNVDGLAVDGDCPDNWEKDHNVAPTIEKGDFAANFCLPNAHTSDTRPEIVIEQALILCHFAAGEGKTSQQGHLINTVGHEIGHNVASFFRENYKYDWGNGIFGGLFSDSPIFKEVVDYFIPESERSASPETLREKVYAAEAERRLALEENQPIVAKLAIPTDQDKAYFKSLCERITEAFSGIDTGLTFPKTDDPNFIQLAGKPVQFWGGVWVPETFADVFGLATALKLAEKQEIPAEEVFESFANGIWEPQDIFCARGGMGPGRYPISPYRAKVAFDLTQAGFFS